MKIYADYPFYVCDYNGTAPEDVFNRAIISASQYIRYITCGRSDNYNGNELKYASCALVDAYVSAYNMSDKHDAVGQKKSENIDGYSVSYVTQTTDGECAEELFKRKAYPLVKQWLFHTGLLSRRVRCVHDCKL